MSFKGLVVWKRSARLSAGLCKQARILKDFGFRNQLTRSDLSIPRNIAEGTVRISYKKTLQLLSITKGSVAKLGTQICIGIQIGYIDKATGSGWIKALMEVR